MPTLPPAAVWPAAVSPIYIHLLFVCVVVRRPPSVRRSNRRVPVRRRRPSFVPSFPRLSWPQDSPNITLQLPKNAAT